jgi:hypothetical protein
MPAGPNAANINMNIAGNALQPVKPVRKNAGKWLNKDLQIACAFFLFLCVDKNF